MPIGPTTLGRIGVHSWQRKLGRRGKERPATGTARPQERAGKQPSTEIDRQVTESTKEGRTAARADRSSGLCGTGILPVAEENGQDAHATPKEENGPDARATPNARAQLEEPIGPGALAAGKAVPDAPRDVGQPRSTAAIEERSTNSTVSWTARDELYRFLEAALGTKEPRTTAAKPVPVTPKKAEKVPRTPAIKAGSTEATISEIRREERYRLTDSTAVSVEIEMNSAGGKGKIEGELVDISQGGVRLRCKSSVAKRDSLTITIVPERSSESLSTRRRCAGRH